MCEFGSFCLCAHGPGPCRSVRAARVRATFLRDLDSAPHDHGLVAQDLAVALRLAATRLLPARCSAYAAAAACAYRADPPRLGEEEAARLADRDVQGHESLMTNELLRSLGWRMVASRRADGYKHVNVRELRARLRHALTEAGRRRSLASW